MKTPEDRQALSPLSRNAHESNDSEPRLVNRIDQVRLPHSQQPHRDTGSNDAMNELVLQAQNLKMGYE